MDEAVPLPVVVAGAGIAGLTAALALAARGFSVDVHERAPRFGEIGAGLQLSPNATRILGRLGVLEALRPAAVKPEAVVLRDAASLDRLAEVPLGRFAEERWGAPYLVAHRADLHGALLARAAAQPSIRLAAGSAVRSVRFSGSGIHVGIEQGEGIVERQAALLVGADGVWSTLRGACRERPESRPSGRMAWRAMVHPASSAGRALAPYAAPEAVTAFLHPAMHLIVYPLRGGAMLNLVVLTEGEGQAPSWANSADTARLAQIMRPLAPALAGLPEAAQPWTAWPIHDVDAAAPWIDPRGLALVGDAAHAMTPFAAQGAAMAIEDAALLAGLLAGPQAGDHAAVLARYEMLRRPRLRRAARRGAFNHFAWHAAGPVALARNAVLKLRPGPRLAADLDWLYGYDADTP